MTDKMKVKREALAVYSAQAREIKKKLINEAMEEGRTAQALALNGLTLNSIIIDNFYKKNGHNEFMTFADWKRKGFSVKKGEKAFVIWGRPINAKIAEAEQEGEGDEYSYFPISHVFSNKQVEIRETED